MASGKQTFAYMLTIVPGKIKTITFCGIWHGGLPLNFISLSSTLSAGHNKFGPDHCFGILKKAYKVSFISSIYELQWATKVVETVD